MWAKPPRTSAFMSVRWTELERRCRGGLRLANCLARFHQFSHWITMLALMEGGREGGEAERALGWVVGLTDFFLSFFPLSFQKQIAQRSSANVQSCKGYK